MRTISDIRKSDPEAERFSEQAINESVVQALRTGLLLVLGTAAIANPFVNGYFLESKIATQLEVWDAANIDQPVYRAYVAV